MNPHKLTIRLLLSLVVLYLCAPAAAAQPRKPPAGGRLAVVVDERLAALRGTPQLCGRLVRRLSRGRMIAIRGSKTTAEGVVFFLVNVTRRTRGWIQREAVVAVGRAGEDRRLLELINASYGFDRTARARIFLDYFPRSPLRPRVLLLLGNAAEEQAAELSREAARRLNATMGSAPEFSYFLNYSGLDRYNRQRVGFVFDRATRRFHYDGAAWRELVRRYPNSAEAAEARQHLDELAAISQ
ncbi:MAG TPA: hypothetical protein VFO72_10925 [Pyrinomonadaceae bacterium]|nr:hypothetical protein [Pyrinomonadaceae bacterium]